MSTINGIDVFLLLALLTALFYLRHEVGQRSYYWLDGFMAAQAPRDGEPEALPMTTSGCYPNLQRASQTDEPYDWERDGL